MLNYAAAAAAAAAVRALLLLSTVCFVHSLDEVALQTYLDKLSTSAYARPVLSPDNQLQINVTFFLQQVIRVKSNRIVVTGVIVVTWFDQSLTWSPANYDNATITRRSTSKVWTPQFVVTNGAGDTQSIIANNQNDQVSVWNTGQVIYERKVLLEDTCLLNLLQFPNDKQTCQLHLAIIGYSYSQTNMSVNSNLNSTGTYFGSIEWRLESWSNFVDSFNVAVSPVAGLNVNYSRFTYSISMKRFSYYYSLVYVMPIIVLSLLAILNFLIPVQNEERISLGVNVILTFIFFLLLMDKFFSHGFNVPWLDVYLLVMFGLSASMLYGGALVLRIYNINPAYSAPSDALFNVIIKTIGTFLGQFGYGNARKIPIRRNYIAATAAAPTSVRDDFTKNIRGNDDLISSKIRSVVIESEDEWRLLASVVNNLFFWIGFVAVSSISIGLLLNVL